MQKFAIIVAGGSGKRMQHKTPKQFLPIDGKPILMYTLGAFASYDKKMAIMLVLPENQIDYWQETCNKLGFDLPHQVVAGGKTRFHSVKNGLMNLEAQDGLVAVHDGVRPLVSVETISRCFCTAEKKGNAIPVVPLTESARKITGGKNLPLFRDEIRVVQTPQVFHVSILKKAYEQGYEEHFTDDASVVERQGHKIHLVEGNPENIKITAKMDLVVAAGLIKNSTRFKGDNR